MSLKPILHALRAYIWPRAEPGLIINDSCIYVIRYRVRQRLVSIIWSYILQYTNDEWLLRIRIGWVPLYRRVIWVIRVNRVSKGDLHSTSFSWAGIHNHWNKIPLKCSVSWHLYTCTVQCGCILIHQSRDSPPMTQLRHEQSYAWMVPGQPRQLVAARSFVSRTTSLQSLLQVHPLSGPLLHTLCSWIHNSLLCEFS